MEITEHLDVKGLSCPLPMLRAKKALAKLKAGDILEVLATDKGAPDDFAAFCRQTSHTLLLSESLPEGVFRLIILRKEDEPAGR